MSTSEIAKIQVNKPFKHYKKLLNVTDELDKVNSKLDVGKEDNSDLLDDSNKKMECLFITKIPVE